MFYPSEGAKLAGAFRAVCIDPSIGSPEENADAPAPSTSYPDPSK